jgi:hypothetical protein
VDHLHLPLNIVGHLLAQPHRCSFARAAAIFALHPIVDEEADDPALS